jgi:hypothetical protein
MFWYIQSKNFKGVMTDLAYREWSIRVSGSEYSNHIAVATEADVRMLDWDGSKFYILNKGR